MFYLAECKPLLQRLILGVDLDAPNLCNLLLLLEDAVSSFPLSLQRLHLLVHSELDVVLDAFTVKRGLHWLTNFRVCGRQLHFSFGWLFNWGALFLLFVYLARLRS